MSLNQHQAMETNPILDGDGICGCGTEASSGGAINIWGTFSLQILALLLYCFQAFRLHRPHMICGVLTLRSNDWIGIVD